MGSLHATADSEHAAAPDQTSGRAFSLGQQGTRAEERSEEHTSELQSPCNLVCRLLLEKKKKITKHKLQQLFNTPSSYTAQANSCKISYIPLLAAVYQLSTTTLYDV